MEIKLVDKMGIGEMEIKIVDEMGTDEIGSYR